jgi:3-oxoacyl-[acyl-carrier-protein] synthase-1
MARLLAGALAEILRAHPGVEADFTLILCLPEPDRPGNPVKDPAALLKATSDILGLPPRLKTRIVAHGRPSGFVALDQARKLIAGGEARNVIVAGVDSYLTTLSIAHYLAEGRILCDGNANGFIPGEAAAAVLCTAGKGPLRLTGLGLAREEAFIYNGLGEEPGLHKPLRGDGMTAAYRAALGEADVDYELVSCRIIDLVGEQFWFKQTTLANMRVERAHVPFRDIWSPAENLGNVGAAVVPLMIGMAFLAAKKGYAPGSSALIESSGDDGACGAAIVHQATN